ncbi:hypothetical protein M427DRAFT_53060 [Gonapodya prolifera JEL478]|uniref:Uncharacterized protein n=1 Tax=Gonapodya prolifera (strain JEL478) TaxID=1344416 RepID=A0A139AQX4_GONPJ|nr:hypothetical protein M427DRAFT_53060 [Gonapodya prolifera JEL478]|eukprot:KXS19064.1 hypothetical protein M427DRAFT_53060 [Gonapodya prolifera JEL478]
MPTYSLLYACPIPVGHRVSISVYSRPKRGLIARGRKICEDEPVIIDRDTGIEYAPPWLYGGGANPNFVTGFPHLGTSHIAAAALESTEEGVVIECRIFSAVFAATGTPWVHTLLTTR